MEKYICNEAKTGKIVKEKINPIKNSYLTKPTGGLWCCRENTPEGFSWEDWCESNCPEWISDERSIITLKENARILVINSDKVWESLPKRENQDYEIFQKVDFEKLAQDYDVLDFRLSEFWDLYDLMYGIDCDSCLIMHPECIENIKEKTEVKTFDDIKTFFENNAKIKQIMVDIAPNESYRYNDTELSKLSDRMWESLKDIQDLLLEVTNGRRHQLIKETISNMQNELANAGLNYDKLLKFYKDNISDMSPEFVENVNKSIFGFSAFPDTFVFNQSTTINEMLHVLHREIETNAMLINQIAGNLEYPVVGPETELSQKIKDTVSFMTINDYGYIVSIDENHAYALFRDKGHALTVEFNVNGETVEMSYYIPKICNPYMVNMLPGVRKVSMDAMIQDNTTGEFNVSKKEFGVKLLTFLENVPSDDNMVFMPGDTLESKATHVEISDILNNLSIENIIKFGKINPDFVLTEEYKDALSSAIQKADLSMDEQTALIAKLNELTPKSKGIQTDIVI